MKTKLLITIALLVISFANAQTFKNIELGVGVDYADEVGISAKANITDVHSAQIIIGIQKESSSFVGRYLYNFNEKNLFNNFTVKPFAFASAGMYISKTTDFSNFNEQTEEFGTKTSNDFGFGAGAGFETKLFIDELKFSAYAGYLKVDSFFYDSGFIFGGGLHYYFKL